MWDLLFNSLAALNIIVAVIAIIGYWTYADYITNLDKNYKTIYGIFSGISTVVFLEFWLLNWFIGDFSTGLSIGITALGVITFAGLVIVGISLVLHGFFKSREYFGKKRNKV